jgi:formylglycine-generating enzyme required for sulfatase activity/nucleoside phosphorylase
MAKVDFLIVTALEEERDAVLGKLSSPQRLNPSARDVRVYYAAQVSAVMPEGEVGEYHLVVMPLLGMGRVQAATATSDAIQQWQPRYVMMVGIAGGVVAKGVALGDVLVSQQIVDYEVQKLTPSGSQVRWQVYQADPRLLAASQNLRDEDWWSLVSASRPVAGQPKRLIGPIASGDKVVASKAILDKYRRHWSTLIGVEMEAAGVAMAAFQAAEPPGFIMVRGVSDLADEGKGKPDVEMWRGYACDVAAAYAIALLKSGPIPMHDPAILEIAPETRRQMELRYLRAIGQRYDHWRNLYTNLEASALRKEQAVKVKPAAQRYLEMQHHLYKDIGYEHEDDRSKAVKLEDFVELREGIRKHGRTALIGDPGAGKTTTLERLAYELAAEAADNEGAPLPLFARLGAYEGEDFSAFLETAFGGLSLQDYLPERVFLLLDGLNETPPEHISAVQDWIVHHPEIKLIVTCRRLDYVNLKLALQRIDVSPLDVNRIHLFIGNYLEDENRERLFWELSGVETRASWEWFQREIREATFDFFWFNDAELPGEISRWSPERRHLIAVRQAIREEGKLPGMLGVVSNPFLLFLSVNTFVQDGKLPANRGQLFQRFVHQLFEKRGQLAVKTRPPWISEDIQCEALAALAYRMRAERTGTSVDANWARQVIEEHLVGSPLPLGEGSGVRANADHILYLAASASIIERGKTVRFIHELLQEYFAARAMREEIGRGVPATKYFPSQRWWEPTGWEEGLLLLAGMEGDATKIVEWLTPVQPTVAYRCATESGATCTDDALQMLFDPQIPPLPVYREGIEVDEWRGKLPRITPLARAEWGRRLAERGDTRKGVGVGPDGLPDIDWVEIPAGKFQYGGDPQAYQSAEAEEFDLPTYYIARYAITYAQFQVFIDADDGIRDDRWWKGLAQEHREILEQYFKYANNPRDTVNWYQAVAFCRWLSHKLWSVRAPLFVSANEQRTGWIPSPQDYDPMKPFTWAVRLPTEQEWEKAARGTDGRKYPWGNDYISGYANIDETFNNVGSYYVRQTSAVGMYPQGASPYGLLDMSGNVWEWCSTDYHTGKNDEFSNTSVHARRGGSWINVNSFARATYRYSRNPRPSYFDYGFRLVCASPL